MHSINYLEIESIRSLAKQKANIIVRMSSNINMIQRRCGNVSKTTIVSSLIIDGETITSENEIAETLNSHFVTVGPDLARKLLPSNATCSEYVTPCGRKFIFKKLNSNDVFRLLSSVKESKTAGLDTIFAKLVKDAANVTVVSLTTYLFNSSLASGIFHLIICSML